MRLRLAFKLHGDEADLARQIAAAAGVSVDAVAKLAMQRYMQDVINRAVEQMKAGQFPRNERAVDVEVNAEQGDTGGALPPPSDAVPSDGLLHP